MKSWQMLYESTKDISNIKFTITKSEPDKNRFPEEDSDSITVYLIRAILNDVVIGWAEFYKEWHSVEQVEVKKQWRRLGIATKLYDFIENKWNIKLFPSDNWIEQDGLNFWKNRDESKIFKRL